ncbi:MAG: toxin-antitoxin system YwqK family antitoxin [Simkaniaceae bacterium]|nr:toxin-antitoxin system YwqK family antitoxin [Simkaniaceae bacterium]
MKKLVSLFICLLAVHFYSYPNEDVQPVATQLKLRQPEWRPKVLESYQDGAPKIAVLYDEGEEGQSLAMKRIHFFPDGKIQEEIDLTQVEEGSESEKNWNSTVVPHGLRVYFRESGQIEKVAVYDHGVLHGPFTQYYPNGKIQQKMTFNQGKRFGKAFVYYEDGVLAEEGQFLNDEPNGDITYYYPNGNRKREIPYVKGKIEGKVQTWFEGGNIQQIENYVHNQLQSEASTPAVIVYDEDNSIREIKHFNKGLAVGTHYTYHDNGQQKAKTEFKDGKMHGICQIFSSKGEKIGEGKYIEGDPVGKHYRMHENKQMAYLAEFDQEGQLLKPIVEYNEKGQLIARYTMTKDNLRDGSFQTWYDDGALQNDYVYQQGQFEGVQREYFSNGQLKREAYYQNNKKNGHFTEYAENGQLTFEVNFVDDQIDGDVKEFYADGSKKSLKTFEKGGLNGSHYEWFQDGSEKLVSCYINGELNGNYIQYNDERKLILKAQYVSGKLDQECESYYADGSLKEKICFKEGVKEGPYCAYYPNGQLQIQMNYKDDQPDKEMLGWHESGSPAFHRQYKSGVFIGQQEEYFDSKDKNKKMISKVMNYDDQGQIDGEQKTYYENGVVQTLLTYHSGALHGMKALWSEQGDLIEEAWYEEDKLEGRFFQRDQSGKEIITFYENNKKEGPYEVYYPENEHLGKVKAIEATYKNNQLFGDVLEYNENGDKVSLTHYVNGKKEGISQLFGPHEKVMMEVAFKDDKRSGKTTSYFPNGKMHKIQQFVDDVQVGEEKVFFENGQLAMLSNLNEGKLHGPTKNWNPQGVLIFEGEYKEGKRDGIFNKYYDDGAPKLVQTFVNDEIHGKKITFDRDGSKSEVAYNHGIKL